MCRSLREPTACRFHLCGEAESVSIEEEVKSGNADGMRVGYYANQPFRVHLARFT